MCSTLYRLTDLPPVWHPAYMYDNLNLSLQFDERKRFLLCGELVKFHLKITSPEFESTDQIQINNFINRIGANVEGLEILEEPEEAAVVIGSSTSGLLTSSTSSIGSCKKMKSVESLSNLLKTTSRDHQNQSKDSQISQCSMSSVTAKRFSSLRREVKPFWSPGDEAIFIPLEVFIDPESFDSSRAIAKIKISLYELIAIDSLTFNYGCEIAKQTCPQKLQNIGQAEISLNVLRPLEVSLRTHPLSSNQAILQFIIEYSYDKTDVDKFLDLEVENVEIYLTNSFNSNNFYNSFFKIVPLSAKQVPFTFETCPQQLSLLFNLSLFDEIPFEASSGDFRVRFELSGRLSETDCNIFSLSFESSIAIFNIFPLADNPAEDIKITSTRILTDKIVQYEPFQVELVLHNHTEEIKSFTLNFREPVTRQTLTPDTSNNPVLKWFKMEESKKTPAILLMSPLDLPLKIDKIPSCGSKAVRLKFVPVKSGFFNLKDELDVFINYHDKSEYIKLDFDSIIIKVE